jgi:anti-anti-sigma regulatory factor
MDSPLPLPDAEFGSDDRSLRLPVHGTTVTAEDLRVRLVLAADLDDVVEVDASTVESVGQAVLQLLVAARAEAERTGGRFRIVNPSPAFTDRVNRCHLAASIGLETGDVQ